MSDKCCCGGSTADPNPDCERCQLIAALTALRTELAEAKQRVAEMEGDSERFAYLATTGLMSDEGIGWTAGNKLDTIRKLVDDKRLPPDRITHIPGKEDHDGEMH